MSEEMFGDFMSMGAWGGGDGGGESDGPESIETGPGSEPSGGEVINLGGGIRLMIHPDVFRKIMHTPEITARVAERCKAISDAANELSIVRGARYKFTVSDNPENIRARGRVKTGNIKAQEDNAQNSTLLKALAQVGPTDRGDPYPTHDTSGPEPGEAGSVPSESSGEMASASTSAGEEAE